MSGPEQLTLDGAPTDGTAAEPVTGPFPPTAEQAAAIGSRDRDVFLEAGAGTGKTRVLVDRYCDAVDLDGVEPERILAFTFTEKAAAEMRRRVRVELMRRARAAGAGERRVRLQRAARSGAAAPISTIHGFCRRLLGAHPVAAGLDPRFRVLDADEAARLAAHAFEQALSELAAGDADVAGVAAGYGPRLAGLIRASYGDLRNHGRPPSLPPLQATAFEGGGEKAADPAELELATSSYGALGRLLERFAARYEVIKAERSGADFDDLQQRALELLERSQAIARSYHERFDHILVDEFQDTSPLQVKLIDALRGPATRLFVVGDEHQSIYAFRGADLESFRAERERARADERAELLPLSGSFRSTPEVVAAVNALGEALLDGFPGLRVGRLPDHPSAGSEGPAVELLLVERDGWKAEGIEIPTACSETAPNRIAEARALARRLRETADAGVERGSMVLLLRAFTHVDAYAEALERAGLEPYVVGGRGYWSAQQVEDGLRLLRCVANPLEDEALFGALASPSCGAGPEALWILRRMAGRRRHVWPALSDHLLEGREPPDNTDTERAEAWRGAAEWARRMPAADRERIERFGRRLVELRVRASLLALDELVERTLEAFDYDLAALALPGGSRRAANLLKLIRIAGEYEAHEGRDLRGFLAYAEQRAARSDRESEAAVAAEDHDGVTVMTVHAAKGLEFDCVAVADLGRGLTAGGAPAPLRLDFDPDADHGDGEPAEPRVGLRLARAGGGSLTLDGYQQISDDAAAAESEESRRLAYVAASRARERLILSGLHEPVDVEGGREELAASHSVLARLLPALGVTDHDHQLVTLPAPLPREDLEASFGEVTASVRIVRPGAEAAAELAREIPALGAAEPESATATPPMLALSEREASAARSLSYAALADFDRCGYRFLIERVLGLGSGIRAQPPLAAAGAGAEPDPGRGALDSDARLGFGRAIHALLETSARGGWEVPDGDLIERVLEREGADPGAAPRARRMIEAWLGSALLTELRERGARFRTELPFRIALGTDTVLRGTIDLLAELDGEPPLIVDYKTDSTVPGEGEVLPAGYEIQRSLYAQAVADALGAERVESAYVFLAEPEKPHRTLLGPAEIAAGTAGVEELIAAIRARRFEVTDAPHAALCNDCPARARLCPHPEELTLAPEPPAGSDGSTVPAEAP